MRLRLTKHWHTVLIMIIVPLTLFPSCLLLLAPLAASTVSLSAFYFCRFIEEHTAFWLLQELLMARL
jgi:hypothetical protein